MEGERERERTTNHARIIFLSIIIILIKLITIRSSTKIPLRPLAVSFSRSVYNARLIAARIMWNT